MIAIRIDFLAGRFHATPWGRAVNEGDVDWPPAPWRLLRAFVAGWLRGNDRDFDRLVRICDVLASPPRYDLPPATLGHTRHYMKQGSIASGLQLDTSLVLDAFAAVKPGAEGVGSAYVVWDAADLDEGDRSTLERTLTNITYLGRAESWCEMRLVPALPTEGDRIPVGLSETILHEGPTVRRLGAACELRGTALLKALLLPTNAMRAERRVQPIGTTWYEYRFPPQFGMDVQDVVTRHRAGLQMPARIERFVLEGPSPGLRPLITETITIAEAMRWAAMRASSDGEGRTADPVLSGKGPDGSPAQGHAHAFFLPRDLDEDMQIDHVDVWFPQGSSTAAHRATVSVRSLYDRRLALPPDARYSVTHLGPVEANTAARWRSATPFVLERHVKMTSRRGGEVKSDGPESQLRRSIAQHGYPEPASAQIATGVQLVGSAERRRTRADMFRRARRGDTSSALGFAVEVEFPTPIVGPLVVGKYAHFGLGQFVPANGADA